MKEAPTTRYSCIAIIAVSLASCISCSDMIESATTQSLPPVSPAARPSGTIAINNDDRYTFSSDTVLNNSVSGAAEMRFSNDGSAWSAWEPYATTKNWTLGNGPGRLYVHGMFRNDTGGTLTIHDGIISFVENTISASDGVAGDYFGGHMTTNNGIPVSINGDGTVIAVGAPQAAGARGAVYVYRWTGGSWNEVKITASDGAINNFFGFCTSLSSDGTLLAAGAYWANKIYVFRYSGGTWNETIITPSSGGAGFGVSVDVSAAASTICVGAYTMRALYILEWNGLSWDQTIVTPTGSPDGFGISVSSSGTGSVVIAGARYDNVMQGSAYIYRRDGPTWVEKKITASDTGDIFGRCVAMSDGGNRAAVGSFAKDVSGNANQGRVYVYDYNGTDWFETRLTASDGHAGDEYGYSVDMSSDGNSIVTGSHLDDISGKADQGSSYLYVWNGTSWDEMRKFYYSAGAAGDRFGYCSRISGDGATVVMGSPGDSGNKGAVVVY